MSSVLSPPLYRVLLASYVVRLHVWVVGNVLVSPKSCTPARIASPHLLASACHLLLHILICRLALPLVSSEIHSETQPCTPPCALLTFALLFTGHEAVSTRSDVEQHLRRRGFVGLDANATRDAIAKEVREVEAMMHKKAWQSKAKGRGRSRRAGVRIADLKERRGIQELSKAAANNVTHAVSPTHPTHQSLCAMSP